MRGALQRVFVPLALAIALGPLAAAGCGGGGNGVGACKQIEEARCNRAASFCQSGSNPIVLTPPNYTNGSSAQACIRYYDTACLNGLEVGSYSPTQVNNCVGAINKGTCAIVETPWDDPSCAWLIPPNTPEASVEAASDAGGDAAEAGDSGDGASE